MSINAVMSRLADLVLRRERGAQRLLVLARQVRLDQLRVRALEGASDAVDDGAGGEHEQRRSARSDLLADSLDEVLVDADVGERAAERAGRARRRRGRAAARRRSGRRGSPRRHRRARPRRSCRRGVGSSASSCPPPRSPWRRRGAGSAPASAGPERRDGALGARSGVESPDGEGGHEAVLSVVTTVARLAATRVMPPHPPRVRRQRATTSNDYVALVDGAIVASAPCA